jgi:hypothetical protein
VTAILRDGDGEWQSVSESVSERSHLSLSIILWVEVKVVKDDSVSRCEVDAKSPSLCREDEDRNRFIFFEAIDELLSLPHRSRSIQSEEVQTHVFHQSSNDIQHLGPLTEDQNTMTLLL